MTIALHTGDCRDLLRNLPDESVHCVVTSPPYWGLRDYGVAEQLGLEPSPDAYVVAMVGVFREVRRVLRKDGTLWLNLGDSYASGEMGRHDHKQAAGICNGEAIAGRARIGNGMGEREQRKQITGLPSKNLIGIPWRVAFALQEDGWVLRQEIIWAKSNPMPESVTDRCTKSHEQLFLFAKAKWSGPAPGRFAFISDEDARWLALCIDTEGCIVVKRVRQNDGGADAFGPQVTFGGTDRALVDRFRQIVGHGNIATRTGKNAAMHYWQLGNNIARDFLHRIYPHLIVKQRQARIAIYVDDLVYYRGGKMPERKKRTSVENDILLSLWARNKACNHFGLPDISDVPEPTFGRWSDCERYYYDADAIKEPMSELTIRVQSSRGYVANQGRPDGADWKADHVGNGHSGLVNGNLRDGTRNKRSVWEIATAPFSEAHFATFPPALIEPCIKAGTSERGCCAKCGAPWVRETEIARRDTRPNKSSKFGDLKSDVRASGETNIAFGLARRTEATVTTLGWLPSCKCDAPTVPCTVLDPFAGAGTTGLVADRLQRDAILIELNPDYSAMSERRILGDAPLFVDVRADPYNGRDDFAKSYNECLRVIRERKVNGGEGWEPK